MSNIRRSMTIGSLVVSEYTTGPIQFRLTALRKGEPVSILSPQNVREIWNFVSTPDPTPPTADDDDIRDLI